MNISSNNLRGFSQYSLLNKLFSQKNGNKTSTSNQMGAAISGGVKHKHSNLYYDENGIPWMSKEQADSTNGKSIPEGTRRNDVINKYLNTLPSKQRSSASWTLDRMAGDYGSRLEALVKQNNPGWKPGDVFDTSILDQLDGTLGGVDFRA